MRRINLTLVFLVLVAGATLLAGSAVEKLAEALILDVIAPRVFLSTVVVMMCFLFYQALVPLFGRKAEAPSPTVFLELLVVVACGTIVTSYSASRMADGLMRGDVRFVLERALAHNPSVHIKSEVEEVAREVNNLAHGYVEVRGLQGIHLKLREYWQRTAPHQASVFLVADGHFEGTQAVASTMYLLAQLSSVPGPVPSSVGAVIVHRARSLLPEGARALGESWGGVTPRLVPEQALVAYRLASRFADRHYESLVGRIGNWDCLFVITQTDQEGREYQARVLIDPSTDEFRELKDMLGELEEMAPEAAPLGAAKETSIGGAGEGAAAVGGARASR